LAVVGEIEQRREIEIACDSDTCYIGLEVATTIWSFNSRQAVKLLAAANMHSSEHHHGPLRTTKSRVDCAASQISLPPVNTVEQSLSMFQSTRETTTLLTTC
jgi:hypothetical protein